MFAKIFTQIFDSSIAEDWKVRVVFEDLLKLCDMDGVVDMTPEAISRRTNVPLDIVTYGLKNLQLPDPKSRSPEHSGKRIVLIDDHRNWGWIIVNYRHYRQVASEEQRREKTRDRVRRFRGHEKDDVTPCNAPVTHTNARNAMHKHKHTNCGGKAPSTSVGFLKMEEEHPPFVKKAVKELEEFLIKSRKLNRRINRQKWYREIELLIQEVNGDKKRIKKVLLHYIELSDLHDDKTPIVESAESFRRKFINVERWVSRHEGALPPPEPERTVQVPPATKFKSEEEHKAYMDKAFGGE